MRFHRLAAGTFQPTELALDLGACLLRERELDELLAELLDLLRLVVVAELLLDRLHLLAQEHLALALAELLLDLRLDLLLRLEERDLALHVHEYLPQALLHREGLEEPLLLRHGELDVPGDEVGELARLGDRVEHLVDDLLGEAAALAELGGALADLLVERREGRVTVVERRHLLHRHHDGGEIALGRGVLERRGALLAMEQELDTAETALHLADARDHAHRVQDVRARLLGVVLLRHGEHEAVALERRLDGAQGAGSPGRDGSGQAREDDGPTEGEDREGLARAHRVGSDRVVREVMVPPRSKGRSALTYDMLAGNATFHRLPDVGPAMAATGRRTTRAA